jgi:hypothetical protein
MRGHVSPGHVCAAGSAPRSRSLPIKRCPTCCAVTSPPPRPTSATSGTSPADRRRLQPVPGHGHGLLLSTDSSRAASRWASARTSCLTCGRAASSWHSRRGQPVLCRAARTSSRSPFRRGLWRARGCLTSLATRGEQGSVPRSRRGRGWVRRRMATSWRSTRSSTSVVVDVRHNSTASPSRKIMYSRRSITPGACLIGDTRWSATQARLLAPHTTSAGRQCVFPDGEHAGVGDRIGHAGPRYGVDLWSNRLLYRARTSTRSSPHPRRVAPKIISLAEPGAALGRGSPSARDMS